MGTIGVRIMDGAGATTTARTTAGIVETPAGSGIYVATLVAPTVAGSYLAVWDTGVVSPTTTSAEELVVTSSAPGFVPATGWAPNYASLADLKAAVGITDSDDDAELGYAITAASRAIDQHTGRQFGLLAAAEPRYYRPRYDRRQGRWVAFIDDLQTTTGLAIATDGAGDGSFTTTLALDTDVRLHPWNAGAVGRPWTSLAAASGVSLAPGAQGFGDRYLRVTARFGWSAVPGVVTQACLIQATRFFKRKDAPFGISGSPEMGSELRLLSVLDPDVMVLLDAVRRVWGIA